MTTPYLDLPARTLDDEREQQPDLDRRTLFRRGLAGVAAASIGAAAALPAAAVADPFALGRQDGVDAEILALFHDWLDATRANDAIPDDDEPEWQRACDRRFAIEDRIFECRGGAAGVAVKAFLRLFQELDNWTPSSNQLKLSGDEAEGGWIASLLRDAAGIVPEIGECAATIVHDDAALIDADIDVHWATTYGLAGEPGPYESPSWRAEIRAKLGCKRDLIANTPAKTPRGEAIKARHALPAGGVA